MCCIYVYIYIVYTEKVRGICIFSQKRIAVDSGLFIFRTRGRERGMGTPLVVIGMSLRFGDVM